MKKILFTGYYFDAFHGSMKHIIEIANYLKTMDYEVYIASVIITDTVQQYCDNLGFHLTYADKIPLDITYDVVWVYHFPIFLYLVNRDLKYNNLITGCLSGSLHPLETPLLLLKETNIPIYVNSNETKQNILEQYPEFEKNIKLLPNLVPDEYTKIRKNNPNQIHSIAIVSNHVPNELKELCEIVSSEITITKYGEDNNVEITPELLLQHDVVITIGKTVQYALALGIPVYNYDIHGGSGYVTLENIDKLEFYNFSGRDSKRKISVDEIMQELFSGYKDVCLQTEELRKIAIERFLLSLNVDKILKETNKEQELYDFEKYKLYYRQIAFLTNEILINYRTSKALSQQLTVKNDTLSLKELELEKIDSERKILSSHLAEAKSNLDILINKNRIYSSYYRYKLFSKIFFGKKRKHYKEKAKIYHEKVRNIRQLYKQKVTAIMCVRNEEYYLPGFLKHIEKYVDAIVAVDDGSTDNTINILENHPLCKKILKLPQHKSEDWNELLNRKMVINLAKEINSDWVLCCDPDERFEENFLKKIRKLINCNDIRCYHIKFRELWDGYNTFRCDGIWDKKEKGILFPLLDNMDFNYNQNHHIPWYPKEITQHINLNYNLYHLKMIKKSDREKRKNLYNKLDPNKEMQKIGYDYLTDLNNIKLKKVSFLKSYDLKTIHKDINN